MNKTKEKNIKKIFDILKTNMPEIAKRKSNSELDFDTAEKAINFIIELYFENLEMFSEATKDSDENDLINAIGAVEGAKRTYEMSKGVSDEKRRSDHISEAQSSLNTAIATLENKAVFYINKQRNIDNMNSFKKFLRGGAILNEIDFNNNLAKQALRALMAAISLQIKIAKYNGDNIQKSVIKPYEDFKNKLLSGNTCLFMNDYDKDYSDKFWINLSESMNTLNLAVEIIEDYDENEDDSTDYENVEFC